MTKATHSFKVLSVIKVLLEGKEVELGNINYRAIYKNSTFQFQYFWMENWNDTDISLEFLIERSGYLTVEDVMEINTKNL